MKISSRLKKTNKFNYVQVAIDNEVRLGARSDIKLFAGPCALQNEDSKKVLTLYNNKKVKYSTLVFIAKKFESSFTNKTESRFLNLLTEFEWESGLILHRELNFVKK
jgi:hypothetical protein